MLRLPNFPQVSDNFFIGFNFAMCSRAALEGLRQLLDSPLLFNIKVDPNFFRTETLQTQSPRIAARSYYRVQWEFMAEVKKRFQKLQKKLV